MNESPVIVRDYVPSDYNYIISTWLRELHDNYSGPLSDKLWFDAHRQWVNQLMANTKVVVKLLVTSDNENEILGYVVAIPNKVLIWIYVRPKFRQVGLGLQLLQTSQSLESPVLSKTRYSMRLKNKLRGRLGRTL